MEKSNWLIVGAWNVLLTTILLLAYGEEADAQLQHHVPLFMSDSNLSQQGLVRIINRSDESGTVRIHAIDDAGGRFGPIDLSLEPEETVHFNSRDLERGNASKGLSGGVGSGSGHWRLELETVLDIKVLAYVRTGDGFLTTMHEVVEAAESPTGYRVPIFNPGSNRDQQSRLRLINPGTQNAEIVITGQDDLGEPPPGGDVRLTLAPGAARMLSAHDLEQGGIGFSGRFGDGSGKWQLFVSARTPIEVMNLLHSHSGHLTNLSRDRTRGSASIPFMPPASNPNQQGFARIINHSDAGGTVRIHAVDDTGARFGPIDLSLDPQETAHFNSRDLEQGNVSKGLSGGVGDGNGSWRLELQTELDIEALAYIRTVDGTLTSMHEVVPAEGVSMRHLVPIFNPGSNRDQRSLLRLVNIGDQPAEITIDGRDDLGQPPPMGEVRLTLQPGAARLITAQELEEGGDGLSGQFGDGSGRWQLFVSARAPLEVMSLLQSSTGHLTNLSSLADGSGDPNSRPVAYDIPLSTDLTVPYIEANLIGTDPDGDILRYVLVGDSSGPGYEFAYVDYESGWMIATLDPGNRTRIEIPYRVTDGMAFSEPARVIVTIRETEETAFGYIPEDVRTYAAVEQDYYGLADLPRSVDLSANFRRPGHQQQQNSCVGWATAYALKSYQERLEERWDLGLRNSQFSPAWIYNQINGGHDEGAQIHDALQLMVDRGAATLATMPYDGHDYLIQPSAEADAEAARFKAHSFARLDSINQWKAAIHNRNPVVIGIPVFPGFNGGTEVYWESYLRGYVDDYHAVTVTGYDDDKYGGAFKVINSWGANSHDGSGYFWLPYATIRHPKFRVESFILHDGPNDRDDEPPRPRPQPRLSCERLPNLQPASWEVDYDSRPGGQGTWRWEVTNTGNATAEAGADVNLLLSDDQRIDGSDHWVEFEEIPFDLGPGESALRDDDNPLHFTIPETIPPGSYYLAMWVDDLDEVRECDETDNVLLGSDQEHLMFSLPDIEIENWYVSWDNSGYGQLEYRVRNNGSRTATDTTWYINLIVHTLPDPREGELHFLFHERAGYVLEPGGSVYRDARNAAGFSVLGVPAGLYYMSLWVDHFDQVHESNEWNNLSTGNNLVERGSSRARAAGVDGKLGTLSAFHANPAVPARQSTFNGRILPDRLSRRVEISEDESGARRVRILEGVRPDASATADRPSHDEDDTRKTHFDKTMSSSDALVFPSTGNIHMP